MIKHDYLPIKESKNKCVVLITLLILFYIFDNPLMASFLGSQIFMYIFKPSLWIGMIVLIWILPRIRPQGKLRFRGFTNWWALNFAFIYIVFIYMAGLIDGLGKSPYSKDPLTLVLNLFVIAVGVIARESLRSYIINSLTKKENYLLFILIALLMTITNFSINRYTGLSSFKNGVMFTAEYFAPQFSKNILLTYLVFIGGAIPAIIYELVLKGVHWTFPILPDLKWITTAFIGILYPLFALLIFQNIYNKETKQLKIKDDEKESPLGWIMTSIASILIVWFAVGVFPIYPSVIATGSMEPMIKPGDVILVDKAKDIEDINGLKVGDVIQFKRDDILISHRIIDIKESKQGIVYKTKGDNNSSSDSELVKPENIKGMIVKVVPKVGLPTLLIKQDKGSSLEGIEF